MSCHVLLTQLSSHMGHTLDHAGKWKKDHRLPQQPGEGPVYVCWPKRRKGWLHAMLVPRYDGEGQKVAEEHWILRPGTRITLCDDDGSGAQLVCGLVHRSYEVAPSKCVRSSKKFILLANPLSKEFKKHNVDHRWAARISAILKPTDACEPTQIVVVPLNSLSPHVASFLRAAPAVREAKERRNEWMKQQAALLPSQQPATPKRVSKAPKRMTAQPETTRRRRSRGPSPRSTRSSCSPSPRGSYRRKRQRQDYADQHSPSGKLRAAHADAAADASAYLMGYGVSASPKVRELIASFAEGHTKDKRTLEHFFRVINSLLLAHGEEMDMMRQKVDALQRQLAAAAEGHAQTETIIGQLSSLKSERKRLRKRVQELEIEKAKLQGTVEGLKRKD